MRCYYDNGMPITKVVFYKDAVWLTIITFMTVGYGDYSPTTNQGRYIMIITVMGGQMFSALVIGMVHS